MPMGNELCSAKLLKIRCTKHPLDKLCTLSRYILAHMYRFPNSVAKGYFYTGFHFLQSIQIFSNSIGLSYKSYII